MSQPSIERLREYLAQLPPKAQALLMREFERAIERGQDITVATFVLDELRKIVRSPDDDITPRTEDPMRLAFRPLEPFLVDDSPIHSPGRIRRSSLGPVWLWLAREGIPEQVRSFQTLISAVRSASNPDLETETRKLQNAAADAIAAVTDPGADAKHLGRVGPQSVIEDIASIGSALRAREALETVRLRLPGYVRIFADSQVTSIAALLNLPSMQKPQTLPFALALVMQRLTEPWQIVRLGISAAASDDEVRIAGTTYAVAITMAIDDLSRAAADLRNDIKRGQYAAATSQLKKLHEGLRGLRTELNFRSDSAWGRKLVALRAEVSNSLQAEIDGVPGRVRRVLRQRPDKEISANSRIDPAEIDEVASLIDFVAVCRNYAGELAINEVTLRTYTDLQQYVEQATQSLVDSLRSGESKVRAFRQKQVKAAIRFCDLLFGPDYAILMNKAAEIAGAGERQASRAAG